MKKIKKFLCSFIATSTVAASIGFTASAYDICDVNRDGNVNVRDVSAISRYLAAGACTDDYSILDVNKSLTVDYMDEQCVLAKVMGYSYSSSYYSKKDKTTSSASAVSEITLNNDADSMSSREYRKYSYTSHKELSSYTLTPTTKPLSSSDSSRTIIGSDDRYESTGTINYSIVLLNMSNAKDSGYATGFIVDDHHIATAAHCVYDVENDAWYTTMNINRYQYDGNVSDFKFTAVEAHIPSEYKLDESHDKYHKGIVKYDYALITVKEDLSNYVHFNLGEAYSVNESNYSNIPIYVTGCPKFNTSGNENVTRQLYTGEGRIIDSYLTYWSNLPVNIILDNTTTLHYDSDMMEGNSGGPAYTVTKNNINNKASYTYTAIAINDASTEKYNCGALITKYVIQFYKNNSYANY